MAETTSYDGFISYSHAADDLLAPRLQAGLQRFAKPWWKRRALRVFRDESSLSANPHLWSSITDALDGSEWFVLLLSEDAAQSEWVNREVEYWLHHKPADRILPVVTDGEFGWDNHDISVSSTAAPPALSGVFSEEPRWVDLRWARTDEHLDLSNPLFSDAVADVASALRGIPKDELASEEVRQHRRTIRTAWAAGVAVLLLGVAATVGAIVAVGQSNEAQDQRDEAERQAQIAQGERDTAQLERGRADQQAEIAQANEQIAREAQSEAEDERDRADANALAAERNAQEATQNELLARSRELAASAINVLGSDPQLSILLALESVSGLDTAELPIESRVALREALYSSHALTRRELENLSPRGVMWSATSTTVGLHVVVDGESAIAYDVDSWDEVWRYAEPDSGDTLADVRFSPDGSQLAVSVVDSESRFLPGGDPDDLPARVLLLSNEGEHKSTLSFGPCPAIQAGPFSPDGLLLPIATGGSTDCEGGDEMWTIHLVDVRTGGEVRSFETYPSPSDFDWTGDSTTLLVSSWRGMGTRLVDVGSGQIITEIPRDAFFGSVSPDGRLIAYGNFDNESVSIFDVDRGHVVNRLTGATDQVVSTIFSPNGSELIGSTRGGGTFVWDVESGEIRRSFPATPPVITMALSGERQTLFHTGTNRITTWDLGVGSEGEFHTENRGLASNANTFDASETIGAIGHVFDDFRVSVFDPQTGRLRDESLLVGTFRGTAVLPDGRVVVMPRDVVIVDGEERERYGPVGLWDPDSGLIEPIWGCSFVDADELNCEDGDGEPFVLETMHTSSDGTVLAISDGEQVFVLDSTTLEAVAEGSFPDGARCLAEFGGYWLAFTSLGCGESGTNAIVTITDLVTGKTLLTVPGSHQVEASHDGTLLAIHEGSGSVVLYDTRSWERVIEVGKTSGRIRGVAFSPDDSKLMLGGTDGFMRVWDLASGDEVERIPINSVSDGYWVDDQHIAVETFTGLWTVVTLDREELLDLAMSRLTRSFTPDECVTYRLDSCPTLEGIRNRG